jgi:hypothetical protein
VPPADVVTLTAALRAEELPAASRAATSNEYAVLAVSPEIVAAVPVTEIASAPLRNTSYAVTPTLSVDAVQPSETVLDVVPVACSPPGTDGAVVSPGAGVVPPPQGPPLTRQLAGATNVPVYAASKPGSTEPPGAIAPFQAALCTVTWLPAWVNVPSHSEVTWAVAGRSNSSVQLEVATVPALAIR